MVPSSPPEFIVVCEAQADATIACSLADRVLCEDEQSPGWIEPEILDALRKWSGFGPNESFTTWSSLPGIFNDPALRIPRFLRRESPDRRNQYDYPEARKAILVAILLQKKRPSIRGLLLIRDMDQQEEERKDSLIKARVDAQLSQLTVVLGMASPKREAWVLNGFVYMDNEEQTRLDQLQHELGFNPCLEIHRLNGRRGEDRDIKRVLNELTNHDKNRERDCWEQTPLPTLRQNGPHTGLAAYLDEVRDRLLPLLSSRQP
jgi:hypothetical protein